MDISTLPINEAKIAYAHLALMDGSETYRAARLRYVPDAVSLADVLRVQTALFKRLSAEIPGWAKADLAQCESALSRVAAEMGYLGGKAGRGKAKMRKTTLYSSTARAMAHARSGESQRRNVDYAALGRKGAEAKRKKRDSE